MLPPPSTAFVLGAGLGTRLKALTAHLPKPLIPVCLSPLITRAFEHLQKAGVQSFVVNTHWKAEAYPATFPERVWNGAPLTFSHEFPEVLETAGGLKFAEAQLKETGPFWVYNGDILSDLPLERAWEAHVASGNEVTLVLRSKDGPLQVGFDAATGRITDLGRRLHPDLRPEFLFTGIYIVEPRFLDRIPAGTKLSVVPVFVDMIREGARLGGVVVDEGRWWDLGARDQYLAVHQQLAEEGGLGGAPWVDPSAEVSPEATLTGACAIGAGAVLKAGAVLEDSIVWSGAVVEAGARLRRCILTAGAQVSGVHEDQDF
ncbi:MAG: sugar phosphate nucleotidyltransferase [Verrucomicrobiota bacterium]